MKSILLKLFTGFLLLTTHQVNAQTYRTTADTFKLNKEYSTVATELASVQEKLDKAQKDLEDYKNKAQQADKDAQDAAVASSNQASKATSGDVGDSRSAKRKAAKAYNKAKAVESANSRIKGKQNDIKKYKRIVDKKTARLKALDGMREKIMLTIPAPAVNSMN